MTVLVELFQEAQIAFIEQAQIVYPITQHRQTLKTGAERKSNVLVWIETQVPYNSGVYLTCAGDFQPTPFQGPASECDIDLGGRLGKGEIRRTKTHLQIVCLEKG